MEWAQILVIILSVFLALFLILGIVLTALLIKVTKQIKSVTEPQQNEQLRSLSRRRATSRHSRRLSLSANS